MKRNLSVKHFAGVVIVLASVALFLVVCGDSSSDNDNTSSNIVVNPNKAVEPAAIGICRVFADKIGLLCEGNKSQLTEWHIKALEEKDTFISECLADEVIVKATAEQLDKMQNDLNAAQNCGEILSVVQ